MKHIYLIILASILVLSLSSQLAADVQSELQTCSRITNDEARLACFDYTANKYDSVKEQINQNRTSSPESIKPSQKLNELAKNTTDQAPIQLRNKQESGALKPASKIDQNSFGKQQKELLESIESRIVGKFRGWRKGTKLTLENGQVWKVLSAGEVYSRIKTPKIRIYKAVFGTFSAKVEGVTRRAKVKRIK